MRSGTLGSVPSTFTTGYQYAGLGYTTALDAAIPPLGARQAHHEFRDTPVLDKAFLVLMGNNHAVMDRIHEGERGRLKEFVAWLLNATRGFGVKVVDPGGIETWKQAQGPDLGARRPGRVVRRHPEETSWSSWHARSTSWACRTRCTCTD